MANANRIMIIMAADGTAYIEGVDKVNSSQKKLESETKSVVSQIKAHWMSVVAAIYAMKKAWDFAEQAAAFAEQKNALNNLTSQYNVTADSMIAAMQKAAEGTISKINAITVANKGMMMGLSPDQLIKFTEMSKRFSDALGTDIAGAFETLTRATAAGQERTLKSLGILVDFQKAQERLAASLGTVAERLTDEERQQANVNEVMRTGAEIIKRMGPDVYTAADAMDQFKAAVSDVSLIIGKVFISAVSYFVGALAWLATGFNQWLSSLLETLAWLAKLGEKIPFVGDKFKGLSKELEDDARYMERLAESSMNLSMEAFNVGTAIWKQTDAVKNNTNEHKNNTKAIGATAEQMQKLAEVATLYEKVLKQISLGGKNNAAEIELENLKNLKERGQVYMKDYVATKQHWENVILANKQRSIEFEIEAENKRYASMEKSRVSGEVLGAMELEHVTKLAQLKGQAADAEKEIRLKQLRDDQETLNLKENLLAIEKEYEETLKTFANAQANAEKSRARTKAIDELYESGLGAEIERITNDETKKNELLEYFSQKRIDIAAREIGILIAGAETHQWAEEGRARIVSKAYQGMQDQLLSFIETGKFSVGALAQVIAQQVKIELTGIAARSAVWAIYETAMGLRDAAVGLPTALVHFAAAQQFATTAAMAFAGAAATQAIFGGRAERSAPGTPGGEPINTREVPFTKQTGSTQTGERTPLEINFHVYGSVVDHDAFAREIVPSITKAINDGVR